MFFTYDRIFRVLFWGCVSFFISETTHFLGLINCSCSAFFTIWFITAGTYLALATLKLPPDGKAVFISGCDSGFGHAIALHLHKKGFRVFAGCFEANTGGAGSQKLKDIGSDKLHVLQLDITRQEDIDAAINTISETLERREVLWSVINNAGIQNYGAVEWVNMTMYKKIFDVNLFGTIALTKACLPLIRKAKGRVVNVASGRGRMATPLGTTYEATKHAMEGFSDGLRLEMKSLGVDVSIIEPGNFTSGTSLYGDKIVSGVAENMWRDMDDQVKEDYGGREYFDQVLASQKAASSSGSKDVSLVVEALTDALIQRFPQGRYQPMGIYIYITMFIYQHFPEWVYDFFCLEILMKIGW